MTTGKPEVWQESCVDGGVRNCLPLVADVVTD